MENTIEENILTMRENKTLTEEEANVLRQFQEFIEGQNVLDSAILLFQTDTQIGSIEYKVNTHDKLKFTAFMHIACRRAENADG